MNVQISKMDLLDLDLIKDSLEYGFDDFWNYNVFKQELENESSYYIVAKENDKIVGFAGFMVVLDQADITNIVVHKNYRNKKIGYMLLGFLLSYLNLKNTIKTISLEVCEDNFHAIKLYENFKFERLGFRKNYYDNKNAIIMTKYLKRLT